MCQTKNFPFKPQNKQKSMKNQRFLVRAELSCVKSCDFLSNGNKEKFGFFFRLWTIDTFWYFQIQFRSRFHWISSSIFSISANMRKIYKYFENKLCDRVLKFCVADVKSIVKLYVEPCYAKKRFGK